MKVHWPFLLSLENSPIKWKKKVGQYIERMSTRMYKYGSFLPSVHKKHFLEGISKTIVFKIIWKKLIYKLSQNVDQKLCLIHLEMKEIQDEWEIDQNLEKKLFKKWKETFDVLLKILRKTSDGWCICDFSKVIKIIWTSRYKLMRK